MSQLRRFNPYRYSDEKVDRLATGREDAVDAILQAIKANFASHPLQHLQVVAPRGFGKSFLMRMVQNRLHAEVEAGMKVAMVLLPEEQRNIRQPAMLLREIQRVLEGRAPETVLARRQVDDEAWPRAVADLDAAVRGRFAGDEEGLLVVAIENFDHLMGIAFKGKPAQQLLRGWLARADGRVMLLGDLHDGHRHGLRQTDLQGLHAGADAAVERG
jgi:hypothetical protein